MRLISRDHISWRAWLLAGGAGSLALSVAFVTPELIRYSTGRTSAEQLCDELRETLIVIPALFLVSSVASSLALRRRQSLLRAWAGAALGSVAVLLAAAASGIAFRSDPTSHDDGPRGWVETLVWVAGDALGAMAIWGGVVMAPLASALAELQRKALDLSRTEAAVLRLRAHLDPHFVLNTLNTVAGLITDEPREARRMIALLGESLREATRDLTETHHAVADELRWLKRYAEIYEVRYKGRIRFSWEVAPETVEERLPRLLLQPLLENAMTHGALRAGWGGLVSVRIRRVDNELVCDVEDDGPGFATTEPRSPASGLAIVARQLELAGASARLSLLTTERGGLARCVLPLAGTKT